MDYRQYLVRDPGVCGGETVFKGTRVTLRTVLASLAEGASAEEILANFRSSMSEIINTIC